MNSLNAIKKLNLKRYKIPSGEITNLPYLKFIGKQQKPIILSTGMSNINEIKEALDVLSASGAKLENISVLHCTSDYPAPLNEINLRAMCTIKELFKVNVVKVNIINQKSKLKMKQGKKSVKSGYKKAIITLKKGQSIDLTTGI